MRLRTASKIYFFNNLLDPLYLHTAPVLAEVTIFA